jgi:hypothetical protein
MKKNKLLDLNRNTIEQKKINRINDDIEEKEQHLINKNKNYKETILQDKISRELFELDELYKVKFEEQKITLQKEYRDRLNFEMRKNDIILKSIIEKQKNDIIITSNKETYLNTEKTILMDLFEEYKNDSNEYIKIKSTLDLSKLNIRNHKNYKTSTLDACYMKLIKTGYDLVGTEDIKNIENFILIVDFPKINGGGVCVFLNTILTHYSKKTNFVIIRNETTKYNKYIITLNDKFLLKIGEKDDIYQYVCDNKDKIKKILINTVISFEIDFLNDIIDLHQNVYTITHDYSTISNIFTPFFYEIKSEHFKQSHILQNKKVKLITQNIKNLNIYHHFLNENEINIIPLPDFSYSQNKIILNENNDEINIGILGAVYFHKGSKILKEILKFYESNNNIKFILIGNTDISHQNLIVEPYENITELNMSLKKYNLNILVDLSICLETYSYSLSLSMLTHLPILSLYKNMDSVVEDRLKMHDKVYYFKNLYEFDSHLYNLKQNYFYTIDTNIYFNLFWDSLFDDSN